MASWAKIDTGLHRNPKVRQAGRDGREVFIWLLLVNREHDFDGTIPARYADPKYMAAELQMRPSLIEKALRRCEEASLVIRPSDGGFRLCGFDDEWRTVRDTSRERMRKLRAQASADTTVGDGDVTAGDGVTALDKSRVEESRDLVAVGDQPSLLVMPERSFSCDLLAIYKRHPRHEGKTKGLAKLQKQIKSPADYADLVRAQTAYLASKPVADGYVKHFDTWVNSWRDHLEAPHDPPQRTYNGRG